MPKAPCGPAQPLIGPFRPKRGRRNVAAACILLGTSRRSSKTYFFIFFFLAFFPVVFFAFFAFLAICPSVKSQMRSLTAQTGIGPHTRKRTMEFARLTLRRLVRGLPRSSVCRGVSTGAREGFSQPRPIFIM